MILSIKRSYLLMSFFVMHIFLAIMVLKSKHTIPHLDFLLFCITFWLLFYFTVIKCPDYAIKFFGFFVYLGFYVKICAHAILVYNFVEPIGDFSGSASEWSEFFLVSSTAAVAISLAALIIKRLNLKPLINFTRDQFIFNSFIKSHKFVFVFILFSTISVAVLNLKLGINVSGLAAITILQWPLNAFIGFMLYMGFVVLLSIFSYNEIVQLNSLKLSIILIIVEAFLSSVSLLSRGIFIFHFLPFFICIFLYRKEIGFNLVKLTLLLFTGVVCYLTSGLLVTEARSNLYDYSLNPSEYSSKNLFSFNPENQYPLFFSQISGLVVDRWIGAEGLMAVISYPNKKIDLIYKSLVRVPKAGEKDVFEEMNKSNYPISTKFVFTSLPGPVAFFYYSGSYFVVFAGMILFVFILHGLQYSVSLIFRNIFLEFQTAFFFAISFMQFGISPRPLFISFFMLFCSLFALRAFKYFSNLYFGKVFLR